MQGLIHMLFSCTKDNSVCVYGHRVGLSNSKLVLYYHSKPVYCAFILVNSYPLKGLPLLTANTCVCDL